jgi:hypothetical protein
MQKSINHLKGGGVSKQNIRDERKQTIMNLYSGEKALDETASMN